MTDTTQENAPPIEPAAGHPGTQGEAPLADEAAQLPEDPASEVLRIHLDQFEGPFEVLLYLIRAQEIDIFDIPIVQVTEQYLRFLELMREENLDIAGEFLVMAATLIQIKSKMILPIEVDDDEEEELDEEDPRIELVEKLLEYRKYRDLGEHLGDLYDRQQDRFARRVRPKYDVAEDEDDGYIEVSLYDLTKAVRSVLRFLREPVVQHLAAEAYSVDQKVGYIEDLLAEKQSATWSELYALCRDKLEVVCYLSAILELCRMHRVRAHQQRVFGEIRLFPREPDSEDAPIADAG